MNGTSGSRILSSYLGVVCAHVSEAASLKVDLARISPLLSDLRHYTPSWLGSDLAAGLSVAAVQVPTAVAYAELAGFSPEIGLYASILPTMVYAIFGSSRQLVVGPDAATCALVASLIAPLAAGSATHYVALASALSIIAGILMLIGGAVGMGFIVNFFARPILIGFLNGIAASIIVGQMGKLFGIKINESDFIPTLYSLLSRIRETNLWALGVGLGTLVCLILLKRFVPRAPAALIAIVAAAVGLLLIGGTSHGVTLVGKLPAGLPHIAMPSASYQAGQGLFVSAIGLVIVTFTSGMLTARSFAARTNSSLEANREMWAFGAANLASGLSGAFSVTGADSRTAVNFTSNNKTQLSSIVSALATAAVAAFLTKPLSFVPQPALAAILIFSAYHLLNFSSALALRRIDILEFRLCLLTTFGVIAFGVLPGVAIAIMFALIVVLTRIYKPADAILGQVPGLDDFNDITLSPQSKTLPNVIVWRFEGPLVFFNADYFKTRAMEALRSCPSPQWFILSMEAVSQMDATGLQVLTEFKQELKVLGIDLLLARPKNYMLKFRQAAEINERFRKSEVFPTIRAALDSIHLDSAA